jgi:hypothetical protein
VPCGDSTANGGPAVWVSVVWVGPTAMSNVRPCQCSPCRVTPEPSWGGSIGSRRTRSERHRSPVRPLVKTCRKPPSPVRKLRAGEPASGSCEPGLDPRASANWANGSRTNGTMDRIRYVCVAHPGWPIAAAPMGCTESVIAGPSGSVRWA